MSELSPSDIEEIKARAEKATAGEWRQERDTTLVWGDCNPDDTTSYGMGYPVAETGLSVAWRRRQYADEETKMANAAFIAHARTDIPRLLAHVSKQDEAIKALEERSNELARDCAEAYQVVGCLADTADLLDHPAVAKALDNLAEPGANRAHDDLLPFIIPDRVASIDSARAQAIAETREALAAAIRASAERLLARATDSGADDEHFERIKLIAGYLDAHADLCLVADVPASSPLKTGGE